MSNNGGNVSTPFTSKSLQSTTYRFSSSFIILNLIQDTGRERIVTLGGDIQYDLGWNLFIQTKYELQLRHT